MLSFTRTEENIVVRSSYKDKQPHSSYLLVKLEDPKVLQVVNVTKTSLAVTDFTVNLKTFPGETNVTLQLWESEGTLHETVLTLMFKHVRAQVLSGVVAGACSPKVEAGCSKTSEANLCYIMEHC